MNQYKSKVVTWILLLLFVVSAHAQSLLQLGELSYSRAPAPHLRKAVTLSPSFFRAVGGVAFNTTAEGRDGLIVTGLKYSPALKDGARLVVTIKKPGVKERHVASQIYDWQLVPIARFAESDDGSAMTLFGSLNDSEFQDNLIQSGGRAINYHPALDNTLVGLRMMQADIMLFDPNAVDLPKIVGKGYVLGKGESQPNINNNKRRFQIVRKLIEEERELGNTYSSYVVGDLNSSIEFYIQNNRLQFSGHPTWTMWDNPADYKSASEFMRLAVEAYEGNKMAQSQLNMRYSSLENLNKAAAKYSAILERYNGKEVPTIINEELSSKVSSLVKKQDGINPVVYKTLITVMQYRALFKHFKKRNPEAYKRFVSSLSKVDVIPVVTTPTVQRSERLH